MRLLAPTLLFTGVTCINAELMDHCGTRDPPSELLFNVANLADTQEKDWMYANKTRTIKTYMHLITSEAEQDLYTKSMVEKQIEVMNHAYAPTGFSFLLKEVTYTINDRWANFTIEDYDTDLEFKQATRKGSYADLNLWFISEISAADLDPWETLMGKAEFPLHSPSKLDLVTDGAIIYAGTLLPEYAYTKMTTAVHETGHWLGLFHTFDGESYEGPGDEVDDTPQQSQKYSGRQCPKGRYPDSCPDKPGSDPVDNFMDYGYCRSEFTPGQIQRMKSMYGRLRAGK